MEKRRSSVAIGSGGSLRGAACRWLRAALCCAALVLCGAGAVRIPCGSPKTGREGQRAELAHDHAAGGGRGGRGGALDGGTGGFVEPVDVRREQEVQALGGAARGPLLAVGDVQRPLLRPERRVCAVQRRGHEGDAFRPDVLRRTRSVTRDRSSARGSRTATVGCFRRAGASKPRQASATDTSTTAVTTA